MKRVKDKAGDTHMALSGKEARQGRLGRPALYVLIVAVIGTVIGIGIVGFVIG